MLRCHGSWELNYSFVSRSNLQKKEQVENSYRQARRKCIPTEKELEKGIIFHQMHWYNFQYVNSSYSQESLIFSHSFQPQFKILFHQPQEMGFYSLLSDIFPTCHKLTNGMLYQEYVSSLNCSIRNVFQYKKSLYFLAVRYELVTLKEPPRSDGCLFPYRSLQGVLCFCTNVWNKPIYWCIFPLLTNMCFFSHSVQQWIYCNLLEYSFYEQTDLFSSRIYVKKPLKQQKTL